MYCDCEGQLQLGMCLECAWYVHGMYLVCPWYVPGLEVVETHRTTVNNVSENNYFGVLIWSIYSLDINCRNYQPNHAHTTKSHTTKSHTTKSHTT